MRKNGRGIGLAAILLVTGILLGLAAVLSKAALMGSRGVHQGDMAKQARYAAYSGMQVVMYEITQDETIDGDQGEVLMPDGDTSYHVLVTNNIDGTDTISAPDGSEVPVGSVQIVSTGKARDGTLQVNAGISGLAGRRDPSFEHAAVGTSRMFLQDGTLVDGWDSRLGPYVPFSPSSPQTNAPIASNAYLNNTVQLGGSAILDGDIQLGPNAAASATSVDPNSTFTGSEDPQSTEFRVPRFVRPPGLTSLGDITGTTPGQTITLTPGAYDNVILAGAPGNPITLNVPSGKYHIDNLDLVNVEVVPQMNGSNDPVELYIEGAEITNPDFRHTVIADTTINDGGNAKDMQMFFTSPQKNHRYRSKVTMSGTDANALMAGNKLDLQANTSEIYGSVAGHTVSTTDSAIHYDQALADVTFNADTGWSVDGVREDVDSDTVVGQVSHEDQCFIATAAYGSLLEPEVVVLRRFRDSCLMTNGPGRAFVRTYYKYSPPLAAYIAERPTLRAIVRCGLTPLVAAVKWPGVTLVLLLLVSYAARRRYRLATL